MDERMRVILGRLSASSPRRRRSKEPNNTVDRAPFRVHRTTCYTISSISPSWPHALPVVLHIVCGFIRRTRPAPLRPLVTHIMQEGQGGSQCLQVGQEPVDGALGREWSLGVPQALASL
ncbi:hypothetical protein GQ53DRAFT_87542 [Thozetella sp. PMI_491]|nr:hypothetical protein GQ53DRAFT_87542 [Thozetella sp. PMI_491]